MVTFLTCNQLYYVISCSSLCQDMWLWFCEISWVCYNSNTCWYLPLDGSRGTPIYYSPTTIVLCSDYTTLVQIMQQEKTTRYCDVFSYGMVLWELLNYKQPFAELSDSDVRQNVLNRKVEHIVHIGIAFQSHQDLCDLPCRGLPSQTHPHVIRGTCMTWCRYVGRQITRFKTTDS